MSERSNHEDDSSSSGLFNGNFLRNGFGASDTSDPLASETIEFEPATDRELLISDILEKIRCDNLLPSFRSNHLDDMSVPISERILFQILKEEALVEMFRKTQSEVLRDRTSSVLTNPQRTGVHLNLSGKPVDLKFEKSLGENVVAVRSVDTGSIYARKKLRRGYDARKEWPKLQAFKNEVSIMKKLDHHHVVSFIASYTRENCFNILMTPVADSDLESLLESSCSSEPGSRDHSILQKSFGCMANALWYLQQQKIRHKDIKPKNILVYEGSVFLADFGISKDYSDSSRSTTENVAAGAPKYWAPEVVQGKEKSSSSDVWSLGCVYLRVWTVLQQIPIRHLDEYLDKYSKRKMRYSQKVGGEKPCNYMDVEAATHWLYSHVHKKHKPKSTIRSREPSSPPSVRDSQSFGPPGWIRKMVKLNRGDRIGLDELVRTIQSCSREYIGECCVAKRGGYTGKELVLRNTQESMARRPPKRSTRRSQIR